MYIDPTQMLEFAFHVTILPADGLVAKCHRASAGKIVTQYYKV